MLVVVVRGVLCHTLHLSCSWGQASHLEQASLYNASKIHYKTGSKEHDRRAKSFARHISASYSLNVHHFHTDCFVTECSAPGSIIMCYSLMNKWCCHFRDLLLNWLVSNPNINDTLFFFPPHCDRCLSSLPPLFCWRNRVHLEEKPASKRQETQGHRCYHSDGVTQLQVTRDWNLTDVNVMFFQNDQKINIGLLFLKMKSIVLW